MAIPGFANGAQAGAEFRVTVGGTPVFGPTMLTLAPRTAQLVFAVGVFPDTFTYIVEAIPIL